MKRSASMFLLLALLTVPSLAQYKFTQVDFPGAAQTNLFAINDKRQYVGASIDANGTNHAIYFDGNTLSLLDPDGVVGTNFSFALSLNLQGEIVGGYVDTLNVSHGFLYSRGNVTTIDYPGAAGTFAFGINDRDEIIGIYSDSSGQHAFLRRDGAFKTIDLAGGVTTPFSINDWGEIVGQYENVANTTGHGYLELNNGKFTTYDAPQAPPNSTFFISINNFNHILGAWLDTNSTFHNFLLVDGKYRSFNLPQSFRPSQVSAQTINDFGDIVGWFADPQKVQHGFLALHKCDPDPGH